MSTSSVSSLVNTVLNATAPQSTTTGTSSFSTDLQSSITRALQIAALPSQLVQADINTVSGESQELTQLSSLFGSLQSSLQSISSAASGGAQTASVSDQSVLSATLSGSALPGTYTVNVVDPGSASSAISVAPQPPVTDPSGQNISQSNSFTLTVNGTTYAIVPPAGNLNSLAQAINDSGAPVQAVIINLGTPSAPSYSLVLQATALGNSSIQLTDSNNNALLDPLNTGTDASYQVNGQPPLVNGQGGISSTSSTVTIAPGLTVDLEAAGASTVTVAASLSNVSSALSSFVSAYNSAVSEVQKNQGQNGGALTGNGIILTMQQALEQIGAYSGGTGSITNLTELGVTFTQQGTLSFDPTVLSGLSQTQIQDAVSFLGAPDTGGFLQAANNALNSLTDPTSGAIALQTTAYQTQTTNDQNKLNEDNDQLTQLQNNLNAQMAQANALIATLQNENTFLQGLFQADTSNNQNASSAG
jgi:flagellar hook-associated protein 2